MRVMFIKVWKMKNVVWIFIWIRDDLWVWRYDFKILFIIFELFVLIFEIVKGRVWVFDLVLL